ncbi:MAG: hypothetical protein IKX31_10740 [Muribaculaceae bacterium]|nr:hypothetical protein [Muribaculaceae bacterium]
MKKILTSLILLACCAIVAQAQMPAAVQRNLPSIIKECNNNKSSQELVDLYAFVDVDGDGIKELCTADYNKKYMSTFKISDGQATRIRTIPQGDIDWQPLFYIYSSEGRDASLDITLKHRPLFLNSIQIAKNRFTTDNETWLTEGVDVGKMKRTYDRIIFKPHVGNAKFVSEKATGKNGLFTFALTDAAMSKKMFRGYSDFQATPFIVPQAWLKDHNPLNYTRWLQGEKEKSASSDITNIISHSFGGRKIIASKWIASCPTNERDFYMVLFAPEDNKGLMAMVCVAEGEVQSAHNEWYELSEDNKYTLNGQDYDKELFFHAPQIMAMVATPAGLELYVRWNSLEGIHYSIWREIDSEWIQIQDDYQYLQAW